MIVDNISRPSPSKPEAVNNIPTEARRSVARILKDCVKGPLRSTPKRRYTGSRGKLNLKAGEWIEVRSREEVLATLDEKGRFENVPFMPEMLEYCGQRLQVFKRADKTCDPAHNPWTIRRLEDSVHLLNVRCNGAGHGGCEAGCLIFWKEVWLKRAGDTAAPAAHQSGPCTVQHVLAASQTSKPGEEPVYSCQITSLRDFTTFMRSWDPRQYFRDVKSGNLFSGQVGDSRAELMLETVLAVLQVFRSVIISAVAGYVSYPRIAGSLQKTPSETLVLQAGELVRVRSKVEIEATLDKLNRNRGLLFDIEMVPYCGGIYRVLRSVHTILDEKTGKMMHMKQPCIILEGVVCQSDFHRLCPRAIHAYWRESWLRRVSDEVPRANQRAEELFSVKPAGDATRPSSDFNCDPACRAHSTF